MVDVSINDTGYKIIPDLKKYVADSGYLKEIALQAVWSVSTRKPGYGVESLRDNSNETYWQSDGFQPHLVNIQFRKKTTVHSVAIYVDYKLDESYTPSKISIKVGSDFNDLKEIEEFQTKEPSGWLWFKLHDRQSTKPVRTFMIQLAVLQNHQNGRDTHLRQIKIFQDERAEGSDNNHLLFGKKMPNFQTDAFKHYMTIR